MGTLDATVRLQALDGTWETCGADRAIQVVPETLTMSANEWGADKASFTLHRQPLAVWPDISAFTPVEIEVGGVVVWEGRTSETPVHSGAEQQISVQCEGWQYHLDDDVYQRCYVHSRLTDWKDSRSFLEADLTRYRSQGQVNTQQGVISVGWATTATVVTNDAVGVTLDLGPSCSAERVVIEIDATGVTVKELLVYVRGTNDANAISTSGSFSDAIAGLEAKGNSGLHAGSFSKGFRYLTMFVVYTGGGGTFAADNLVRITKASVFGSTAWESGNESALLASEVFTDAVEAATLQLSTDLSGIDPTSFHLPDFSVAKATTPREAITAANAYHNWIAKVAAGRRPLYEARPTAPTLEIGAWSGADVEDTSANAGDEIYSRALVEATGPDGTPLVAERVASQQPSANFQVLSSPAPGNPSFATNTATWSVTGGTLTRETVVFDTTPAGGKWAVTATGQQLTETFSGAAFQQGTTYRLAMALRQTSAKQATLQFGYIGQDEAKLEPLIPSAHFTEYQIIWTPRSTIAAEHVTLRVTNESTGSGTIYIDSLVLASSAATLAERRGFRRTKVIQPSSAITEAEGNQLADVFLESHITTPFKGSAAVIPGGARRVIGGQPVHPSLLLLHTQELLRLGNVIDPDTGGVGREGTIAEVAYTHKDQRAQVTLDDKRGNFQALLERLAVVQTPGT